MNRKTLTIVTGCPEIRQDPNDELHAKGKKQGFVEDFEGRVTLTVGYIDQLLRPARF